MTRKRAIRKLVSRCTTEHNLVDAVRIVSLCYLLQRRNQAINTVSGDRMADSRILLSESHLLMELHSNPVLGISDLSAILMLDQGTISRIVLKLSKDGLLEKVSDSKDGRRFRLQVTTKGRETIESIDRSANGHLERFSKALSSAELEKLVEYVRSMCDGMEAPPSHLREGEHCMRPQQRRIARCLSMFKRSAEKLGISPTERHILSVVRDSPSLLGPSDIAKHLSLASSNVSTSVAKLESGGFVTRIESNADARATRVRITDLGAAKLQSIVKEEGLRVARAIRLLSKKQIQEFIALFERFVGDDSLVSLSNGIIVRRLAEFELTVARGFFIELAVTRKELPFVPELLFSSEQYCYGGFRNSNLSAVAQFSLHNDLGALSAWANRMPESIVKARLMFESIVSLFKAQSGAREVIVSYEPALKVRPQLRNI